MMDTILIELSKGAGVFGLAFVLFWSAIPLGLGMGLHPLVIIALTTLSYTSAVIIVMLFGDRLRAWLMRWRMKHGQSTDTSAPKLSPRLQAIMERYGIWGFGLVAPMTVGPQIGGALGVVMNAPIYRFIVAMFLGALVWSIGLTIAFMLGLMSLQAVG